jgi:hypothetical protein
MPSIYEFNANLVFQAILGHVDKFHWAKPIRKIAFSPAINKKGAEAPSLVHDLALKPCQDE